MRAALQLTGEEVHQALNMYLLVKGYHIVEDAKVAGVIVEVEPSDKKDLHIDPNLRRLILNAYNREHYDYRRERVKRIKRELKQVMQQKVG